MDASSMQPDCRTESCSSPSQTIFQKSPIQTTSPENLEINYTASVNQEIKENCSTVAEDIKSESSIPSPEIHELNCTASVNQKIKGKCPTVAEELGSESSIPLQNISVLEHVLNEEQAMIATSNTMVDSAFKSLVAEDKRSESSIPLQNITVLGHVVNEEQAIIASSNNLVDSAFKSTVAEYIRSESSIPRQNISVLEHVLNEEQAMISTSNSLVDSTLGNSLVDLAFRSTVAENVRSESSVPLQTVSVLEHVLNEEQAMISTSNSMVDSPLGNSLVDSAFRSTVAEDIRSESSIPLQNVSVPEHVLNEEQTMVATSNNLVNSDLGKFLVDSAFRSTVAEDIRSKSSTPLQNVSVPEHVLNEDHAMIATSNSLGDSALGNSLVDSAFRSTVDEDIRPERSIPLQNVSVAKDMFNEEQALTATTNKLVDSALRNPVATSFDSGIIGENSLSATQLGISLEDEVEKSGAENINEDHAMIATSNSLGDLQNVSVPEHVLNEDHAMIATSNSLGDSALENSLVDSAFRFTVDEDIRPESSIPLQNVSVAEDMFNEEQAMTATTNKLVDSALRNPVATSFDSGNIGENSLSATQLGISLEDEVEKSGAENIKVSAENGIEESNPVNAVKRSRGRPRKSSTKSAENVKVSADNGLENFHPGSTVKRSQGRLRKSSIKSTEGNDSDEVEKTGAEKRKASAGNGIEESDQVIAVKRSRGRPRKSSLKSTEGNDSDEVEKNGAEKMKASAESGIEESEPVIAVIRSRGRPRKSSIKLTEGNDSDEVEKTGAEKMKPSVENGIEESEPVIAVKRSRGRPRKSSIKLTEAYNLDEVEKTGAENIKVSGENGTEESEPVNVVKRSRGRPRKSSTKSSENGLDEFSRTRTHLRYLLHRMAYERNLIDAYSGEGWKGQSAEKLRPERELQRANSEIFRCKLKVRNLFQQIDTSLAEGRLLFDLKGEIDSEDIFCAKCGSKDVTLENDIILCDGPCERGFHQFCIQPPLLKEKIPPDDEGWLCPGCRCKDDCVHLLNESQGTNLSFLDSWEKVYPDAAATAAAGKTLDNNLDLPSDDSEDDYRPDDSDVEEEAEGDDSSADDSDTYSASKDAKIGLASGQYLQVPSDDSEDDDFDPDAADVDEDIKQQTSSSDFSSDSEDLNFMVDSNGSLGENSGMPTEFMSGSSKVGQGKKSSSDDELSSLLETGASQGESVLISAKREAERLDYKKLYDEQYGNVSTDSSDEEYIVADEEYIDAADAPKRRRDKETECGKAPKRRAQKKLKTGSKNSPAKSSEAPSEPGSRCGGANSSAARRLGEAATQGLLTSFRENQYPDRAKKEKLAEELGIKIDQVSKWFENARWSFRHASPWETKLAEAPTDTESHPPINTTAKNTPSSVQDHQEDDKSTK